MSVYSLAKVSYLGHWLLFVGKQESEYDNIQLVIVKLEWQPYCNILDVSPQYLKTCTIYK